jgi:hypothetical protein
LLKLIAPLLYLLSQLLNLSIVPFYKRLNLLLLYLKCLGSWMCRLLKKVCENCSKGVTDNWRYWQILQICWRWDASREGVHEGRKQGINDSAQCFFLLPGSSSLGIVLSLRCLLLFFLFLLHSYIKSCQQLLAESLILSLEALIVGLPELLIICPIVIGIEI